MKREIILDTETTGLDPNGGHRMVEIGCVELMGGLRTGEIFHTYLNPGRDVPDEAFRVHGLSTAFLQDKPIFAEKIDAFLEFIADAQLVIHNAAFDMKFINFEMGQLGFPAINSERILDTLLLARKKFPGSPASLDALCKRFAIDLSNREKHGALLDAELLADVYLELLGGRQAVMGLEVALPRPIIHAGDQPDIITRETRHFPVSEEESQAHAAMCEKIKNPVWKNYSG